MGEQLPLTTPMQSWAWATGKPGHSGNQPRLRQYSVKAYCKPDEEALKTPGPR
jgi:hypothetical protein